MNIGHVFAALFVPPLAVYLARGGGRDFLIACLLTLLAFIPGLLYALWVVIDEARHRPEPA